MFGLGPTEIIIILVVALIFVGPAKLPEIARNIGRGLRDLRRVSDDFQREIQRASWEQEEIDKRNAPPRPGGAPPASHTKPPKVEPRPAEGAVAWSDDANEQRSASTSTNEPTSTSGPSESTSPKDDAATTEVVAPSAPEKTGPA